MIYDTTRRTTSTKRQSISVSKMFQKYESRGLTPPPASEKFVSSQIEGDGWPSTVTILVTNQGRSQDFISTEAKG